VILDAAVFGEEEKLVRVIGEPMVLHKNIRDQWGMHTFAYILKGEKSLYWSASAYDKTDKTHELLVGKYPLQQETSGIVSSVSTIRLVEPTVATV